MSIIQTDDVPSNGSQTFRPNVDWPELLYRVQQNEAGAGEELYSLVSKGMLFFLRRQMSAHLAEERMHGAFMIVLKAIQDGRIKDAKDFSGYLMTVTKGQYRQDFHHIRSSENATACSDEFVLDGLPSKAKYNPDSGLEAQRRSTLMAQVLRSMSPECREILNRFYVLEQSQEQICTEMKLTDNHFRLLKSRAKVEFKERGRSKLTPWKPFFVEIFSRILSANGREKRARA